jgi:hypothetical protein
MGYQKKKHTFYLQQDSHSLKRQALAAWSGKKSSRGDCVLYAYTRLLEDKRNGLSKISISLGKVIKVLEKIAIMGDLGGLRVIFYKHKWLKVLQGSPGIRRETQL